MCKLLTEEDPEIPDKFFQKHDTKNFNRIRKAKMIRRFAGLTTKLKRRYIFCCTFSMDMVDWEIDEKRSEFCFLVNFVVSKSNNLLQF